MKNFIILSLIVSFLVFGYGIAVAQEEGETTVDNGVTIEDLGVKKPRLLPTSPFYFFKEWRRGIQRFFTFNSVAKTELELRFVNERATEVKVLEDQGKDDLRGIEKALDNYSRNVERLEKRITLLKETSENPRVDQLLDLLAHRTIVHQQLFEELRLKKEALKDIIEDVREKLDDMNVKAIVKLDSPEKFKLRFEKAISDQKEELLKEFKAINILDRLEKKLPDEVREKILELKGDLILKFEGRFKVGSGDELLRVLDEVSIADPEKLRVFDEIRERITDPSLKSILNIVRRNALEVSENGNIVEEPEANEMIKLAKDLVLELEEKISSGKYLTSGAIGQLLERAEFHVEQAEKFYGEGQYGPAFGQATAAQAVAKNGLSQLLQSLEELDEASVSLRVEFDQLKAEAKEKDLTRETKPELFDLFDETEKVVIDIETVEEVRDAKVKLAEVEVSIESVSRTDVRGPETYTITITDKGFSPREMKIKKGDVVTWINKTARASWPASASHPTHRVYPEGGGCISSAFDACRRLKIGESWSFTFGEVGKWGYHDHLASSITGVVVVE